jgi:hypothetical protein
MIDGENRGKQDDAQKATTSPGDEAIGKKGKEKRKTTHSKPASRRDNVETLCMKYVQTDYCGLHISRLEASPRNERAAKISVLIPPNMEDTISLNRPEIGR